MTRTGSAVDLRSTLDALRSVIKAPTEGLPEDTFLFVSEITPLVNVDLLVKNEQGQTLLTWRDDGLYRPGWHVPGGVIRFKEKFADRIQAVAANELGAAVRFQPTPLIVNEVIHPSRSVRGHFVSFLYACTLTSALDETLKQQDESPKPGQWAWHDRCPDNIISVHEIYRDFMDKAPSNQRAFQRPDPQEEIAQCLIRSN
jgi:ADP-ribose pyrophosphatase YjhB (NUDIX family)